ncbi:DUF3658 domain-containing protein [Burkholderia cenocepacia]|uniref:DUF3658 domain-containing protein n=1 Tax=Burkholderia cenocepacia TaxID=95486 RepID=UPI00196A2BC4|nr:DUF3658 domain-containing protein [Burkholderia cenocepacia]MBN3505419.1 hypothetical protein [Burkholderia cenocepacia]MCO1392523.1 DUF3658 domain-containing protein [Burkholderia cenocepacia]MCO1406660.1 DUF3658 domain-containing protein [Burkholderia cenocepacia]UQN95484.1 DUF3658 domain-containing protein [Burkholderia cenocepacia]UQO03549.1 DUF3658 domain-containing protein [Burkholderia cenocepacia]
MIRNKDYRDLIHASFSNIAFNAISSAISAGHLTGPHVLIGGNWHLGPLKERKLSTLSTWFSDHFGYIPPDLIVNTTTPSTNGSIKICAWVNPLSSIEYSNFIHWVSHHNPDNFLLTLAPEKTAYPVADNFLDPVKLLDNAIDKKSSDINSYIAEWNVLIEENADLRMINDIGKIQSFRSSDFDKYIINSITRNWEPSPVVVLRTIEKIHSEIRDFPGDIFLYRRLEKFSLSGIIEKQAEVNVTRTRIRIARP